MRHRPPDRPALERRIVALELRHAALTSRSLHIVPLLGAGILAVSLPFPPPPLLAAVWIGLAALEPHYNTMLYRTPREFQAMSLLPANQRSIVRAKNVATVLLSAGAALIAALVLQFFSRSAISTRDAADGLLLFLSLAFPLLHAGNRRSLQYPRRVSGWQTDDLIEGVGFLVTIAVLSIPFLLLAGALDSPLLCLLYTVAVAAYWFRVSVPSTARWIDSQRIMLCSRP